MSLGDDLSNINTYKSNKITIGMNEMKVNIIANV